MAYSDIEQYEPPGQVVTYSKLLFISKNYGAKPLDRYKCSSGEYYKVEEVESNRFDNVDMCWLVEDTR